MLFGLNDFSFFLFLEVEKVIVFGSGGNGISNMILILK